MPEYVTIKTMCPECGSINNVMMEFPDQNTCCPICGRFYRAKEISCGFTMLEVIISMSLFAIIALAMNVFLLHAMRQSVEIRKSTEIGYRASYLLDSLKRVPYDTLPADTVITRRDGRAVYYVKIDEIIGDSSQCNGAGDYVVTFRGHRFTICHDIADDFRRHCHHFDDDHGQGDRVEFIMHEHGRNDVEYLHIPKKYAWTLSQSAYKKITVVATWGVYHRFEVSAMSSHPVTEIPGYSFKPGRNWFY
jgi:prepilin-type N-terminal cleavage/methylation domain-containing protein